MTNNFNPDQLRGQPKNKAQFRANPNGDPESPLTEPRTLPVVGDTVQWGSDTQEVVNVDFETFMVKNDEGDMRLISTKDVADAARIGAVNDKFDEALKKSPVKVRRLAAVSKHINEGAWGDISHAAVQDFHRILDARAHAASSQGADGSDLNDSHPLHAQAEHGYEERHEVMRRAHPAVPDEQYAANTIAFDAAVSLANRDYIGNANYPGWTQEAYDHMTRPWREVFGPIHEDDDINPPSWSKRPL